MPATDSQHCPLCQQTNHCAVAAGNSGDNCWCMHNPVPKQALANIPTADRNKRCICQHCAEQAAKLSKEIL